MTRKKKNDGDSGGVAVAECPGGLLSSKPADAIRISLPGQPKADVEDLGDGKYRVSYPGPQTMFWPAGSEPKPTEVVANGETDAYNRAGGITGHDKPHVIED